MPAPPHPSDPRLPAATAPRRPGLSTVQGRFSARLTLQTLGRGDGLLGLLRHAVFGPRGDTVTVARIDWLYRHGDELLWQTPAPRSVLGNRPMPTEIVSDRQGQTWLLHRDLGAEAEATDRLRSLGLHPLDAGQLQWRSEDAASQALPEAEAAQLWSLPQEDAFADFWADQAPLLQAQGWSVVLRPGFAHLSVPVQAWRVLIEPDSGELLGHELAAPQAPRPPKIQPLGLPPRQGAWLLSLGLVIEGETLDLAPLLAELLRRDARWLNSDRLLCIADDELLALRAPGG